MHPMLKNTSKSSKIVIYSPSDNTKQYLLHAVAVGLCIYEDRTALTFPDPADAFMGVILSGRAECAIGSCKTETAVENELIFAPAGVRRVLIFERGTVVLWIDFNGPSAVGYYNMIKADEVHVHHGDCVHYILPPLRESLTPPVSTSASEVQNALMLTTALTHLCTAQKQIVDSSEEEVMDRILHRIVNNIADPPSVKEMAETAGYSQAHFIRVFSRQTGLTPHQYIISIRIDRAKHLLATTHLPLRTIASMIGYTSESMFCSAFRKATNITAKEYRSAAANSGLNAELDILRTVTDAIVSGNSADIGRLCRNALNTQHTTRKILDTMMSGMEIVEGLYTRGEIQLSEMLLSAKALKKGLHALEPNISDSDRIGSAIIGTVAGDLHDIGKNLVALLMQSVGFKIIDLGVDVSAEDFIAAYHANPDVRIITISALLLSSKPIMENTVKQLNEQPFRKNVKLLVGGGTVDEEFARRIGADAYTSTALNAARTARLITLGEEHA